MYANTYDIFQWFKKRMTFYAVLPPNIISELKTCDVVDIDLIGPYSKSIIQKQPV